MDNNVQQYINPPPLWIVREDQHTSYLETFYLVPGETKLLLDTMTAKQQTAQTSLMKCEN